MSTDFWWGALAGVITVLAIEVVGTFVAILILRGVVVFDGRTWTLEGDDERHPS